MNPKPGGGHLRDHHHVIEIDGLPTRVAPTSTVMGAAVANALVAEVVERLVDRGIVPAVFTSANVAGGDAANDVHLHADPAAVRIGGPS